VTTREAEVNRVSRTPPLTWGQDSYREGEGGLVRGRVVWRVEGRERVVDTVTDRAG
jgi:hypothetical protein